MARRPRLELPGVPLHLIQRGNNRGLCFHTDEDRRLYLRCLGDASVRHQCAIHAYVLMANHVHLLATPAAAGRAACMMQDLGRRYVRLFNDSYERTGTLWEGRYKSGLIDSETYFLTCHRYIELNPVRAGIVGDPAEYPWSSYAYYAFGAHDPLITPHAIFDRLGSDAASRRLSYRALCKQAIEPQIVEHIRICTKQGWALGSPDFLQGIEAALGRRARPPKRGRPLKTEQAALPALDGQKMLI